MADTIKRRPRAILKTRAAMRAGLLLKVFIALLALHGINVAHKLPFEQLLETHTRDFAARSAWLHIEIGHQRTPLSIDLLYSLATALSALGATSHQGYSSHQ